MGPQITVSEHVLVQITKTPQDRIRVYSFRSRSLFWGFEWNERSNDPEKKSNTRYSGEPQYIFCAVAGT